MKKITEFRFYASLNDFLSVDNRQKIVAYSYWGNPTVKDAIEALGVPHPEIKLILVDQKPVDFDYHIQSGEFISVYPRFRTLGVADANPLPQHILPSPLRFLADAQLGKLARHLRMLGFDVLYDNQFNDHQIIYTSVNEKRIILTRNLGILKQRNVTHGYFLRNTEPNEQLKEVIRHYDLVIQFNPFSRCMECNAPLEKVTKSNIIDRLEPLTQQNFHEFFQCSGCNKIYWKGSHYERMKELVGDLSGEEP